MVNVFALKSDVGLPRSTMIAFVGKFKDGSKRTRSLDGFPVNHLGDCLGNRVTKGELPPTSTNERHAKPTEIIQPQNKGPSKGSRKF